MALSAGSIAFTGFNGDGNDNLSFVALTDIPQGTVINFTDTNWNGAGFASGSSAESSIAWTATTAISAGTVIDINNIGSGTLGASAGTVSFTNSNNTGLSNDSEVVYAYVGTAAAPTFLAAISNVGYSTSDGTLSGTGLVAGQTAVSFTGGLDIVAYNGARTGQASFAAYLAAINNPANWLTQNGSGNQSTDGTAPDAPFPTAAFTVTPPATQTISFLSSSVSIAEGDSGTRTLTFSVVRSGGTTGEVSFSGTFAAGATNAADYGGALPASTFSGAIAAGASSATVSILVSGDTTAEPDEGFTLTLTSAGNPGAAVTIGTATATGTIINDDGTLLSGDSSTPITLANNDHLTILNGVTLSGSTPVTWVGGSTSPGALLDNFGTVSGTNRAIYTSGSTDGSFTVHNAAGATITAVKDAIKISNLGSGASGTFTLNNEGTISSTGTGGNAGQALDLDDIASAGGSRIRNAASGVIQAADADAIRAGTNAIIENYGQIISHNGSASSTGNDAIDFQSVNAGGVVNNYAGGVIDGARHGITGDQPITVDNAGTISGEAGSGINLDTAGATTTVVNNAATGTITGHAVNGADADAIDVDGLVWIDNFGTIEAVGLTTGANGLNEALAIGGGLVHNEAGGLITSDQRAITVDDSNNGSAFGAITIINDGRIYGPNEAISITGTFADTITNTGLIEGNVAMGDGNDTLTSSGTIIGDTLMGAGDDSIHLVTGSTFGTLDGGDGTDTIYLSGSGSGWIRTAVNVEYLVVQSGTWLDGDTSATNYAGISVESGATLVVWGDAGTTTVAEGATEIVHTRVFDTTVFGQQLVMAGGTASGTQIEFGGEQHIYYGGAASGTTVDGGDQFVYGTADQTTIGAHGLQYLYGGATSTTIDNGGAQNIYTTGTATGTTLNAGGTQIDWGTASGTTINGGAQYVWGTATDTTILSGAQLVGAGGTAYATAIDSGGEQVIYDGGVSNAAVIAGGEQTVYGSADQTTIGDGGLQSVHGDATNTIVGSGGQQNVHVDGTATGTTLNAGATQIDWGTAVDTTINGGTQYVWGSATSTMVAAGTQLVGAGGTANGTTIDGGGEQNVYEGATASGTTLAGGDQLVYGLADLTTIGNGGLQYVYGSATSTTIDNGGEQNIYTDGIATGTTLNAGAIQIDWGAAVGTIINGGIQYVWGSATGTIILGGVQHVGSGGIASETTIDSGGIAYVHTGGTAHDVMFDGPNATLALDQAADFSGTISGWEDGDKIDLGDILFSEGSTTLAYTANQDNTGGTLTVSDGSQIASLALLGQYTVADFALSSDGHGGTLISDPGVAAQTIIAVPLHA